jgi:hypothetical protein
MKVGGNYMYKKGFTERSFLLYVAVFIAGAIVASAFWNLNQLILFRDISFEEDYDYIIYKEAEKIVVKNGATGCIDFVESDFQKALNNILKDNVRVFLKNDSYDITSDIFLENLENVKILSNGAKLNFNKKSFVIRGENYKLSRYNSIEGVSIINGSVKIENSFMVSIRRCNFIDSENGVIFLNTNGWTECSVIEDCFFINVRKCVIFKTPQDNGTESYASTEIKRCYFELVNANSVAIHVEARADFNEGLVQNIRVWMGGLCCVNQTGILVEGSMLNTLLEDTVFESFAKLPLNVYGIRLERNSEPPIFGQSLVFLGNMTNKIYNPFGKWLYGIGGAFKIENLSIPLSFNNAYGECKEITPPSYLSFSISTLNLKIQVEGNFSLNENVTLRLRLKFMDGSTSRELTKCFNSAMSIWLDHDDFLILWPTTNIISSLMIDARTNLPSSNVNIYISLYGSYN